ncbi:hypothetical protein [Actinoplanes palleronii]|uniref:Adhesin domain-containing protein n=1 Tax=Actinoplanes palleronii TaxID=113570 RepID=A0ABQ4BIG7_9ACTN|nr:hypothetical protein [Actinoplanes palleronii]GIE70478.1 hypothetical protein Apa02nite_065860 [Actinoplanes palleronii]
MTEVPAENPQTDPDRAVRYATGIQPVPGGIPAPEPVAPDQAALDRAAFDQAALEQAARDQAAFDQAAWDQAAFDQAAGPEPAAAPEPFGASDQDAVAGPAAAGPGAATGGGRVTLPMPDRAVPGGGEVERTSAWPAPEPVDFAEEDTDPTGFTPVSGIAYPPASDPFDDPGFTSAYPLPGWSAPPDLEPLPITARRRKPLLMAAGAIALAGLVAAFLLVPRAAKPTPEAAAATARPTTEPAAEPTADNGGTAPAGDAGGAGPTGGATATGPLTGARNGLDAASFDLVDSATLVQLSAADLGDDLFRVSTASDSGLTPSADQDGDAVKLRLRSDGSGGSAAVTITLNSAVRWTLRVDGGVAHSRIDLTGADLAAVDLNGGASRIDLTLPEPHGLMPVRMTGGVDQFLVNLAGSTPVRVRVQSGAGQVTLDGSTHKGIAPGRSFTANGWAAGEAGVDLLAVAGMSALTVTN